MTEVRLVQEDFWKCYGWAYQTCGKPASWVGIEVRYGGSWSAIPYCSEHAATWLGDTSDWTEQPESRTLIERRVAQAIWMSPTE